MKTIFEGRHAIDTDGNVYSCINRRGNLREFPIKMKPSLKRAGYLAVVLYTRARDPSSKICINIHRLMAQTYLPNPQNKPCVNHINGNKLDNSLSNLEWVTNSENDCHAYKEKLRTPNLGGTGKFNEDHPKSKPVNMLTLDGILVKRFPSMQEASRQGYSQANISSVALGRRKTHKGHLWEFA